VPEFPTTCPSCRGALAATRLTCGACATQVEGSFELPALLRLSPQDLEFVARFVKASGSLKDLAAQYGQSYPTIRNRLNQVIAQLGDDEQRRIERRHAILDAIAKGTLSVAAAERQLRELAE
jgi:hypothetical protein